MIDASRITNALLVHLVETTEERDALRKQVVETRAELAQLTERVDDITKRRRKPAAKKTPVKKR